MLLLVNDDTAVPGSLASAWVEAINSLHLVTGSSELVPCISWMEDAWDPSTRKCHNVGL
jgi:hypothetical protein